MRIQWFNRRGYSSYGDVLLKDEMGFYKVSYSNHTAEDIACFHLYTYIYRHVHDGKVTDKWCVKMEDGSFMDIDKAKELDRKSDCVVV